MSYDLKYDLTDYNELIGSKYQDAPPVLDAYQAAPTHQEDKINISLDQYATHQPAHRTQTFAPNLTDTYIKPGIPTSHRELIDMSTGGFLLDEIEIAETKVKAKEEVHEKEDTQFTTRFKLNAVGMVAVVSFIAVTLMVIAFIIANSISIAGSKSRISALQANNTEIAGLLIAQQDANADLYDTRANEVIEMMNDGTLTNTYGMQDLNTLPPGYSYIGTVPQGSWNSPPSSGGKGVFNAIAKFFNKIF